MFVEGKNLRSSQAELVSCAWIFGFILGLKTVTLDLDEDWKWKFMEDTVLASWMSIGVNIIIDQISSVRSTLNSGRKKSKIYFYSPTSTVKNLNANWNTDKCFVWKWKIKIISDMGKFYFKKWTLCSFSYSPLF
ncbi:uncharacterized protein LOC117175273 [Belonocnema kinseyi]|uniref:uncharacterized protein LOC117175273 n=1 Tax=Belonocnema kinseyi TaxID=2817044 RepID=UPI00143D2892|nr:uncharacterized protein LOC117175273 [Belonocnema kinseyi]